MKFGKLIFRKNIEIVATRCHILKLKYTKFNFVWGSAPDPAGALPQTPLGLCMPQTPLGLTALHQTPSWI